MIQLIERAFDHQGLQLSSNGLSRIVEFFRTSSTGQSKEGRQFRSHPGKEMGQHTRGRTPPRRSPDELVRITRIAPVPGVFGVFYETDRPTKKRLEKKWLRTRAKGMATPANRRLQKTFDK